MVALILYKTTLQILECLKGFSNDDPGLMPRISSSIATITMRVHILSNDTFSQVGVQTMQADDSQCISAHPLTQTAHESRVHPTSEPIDIPSSRTRKSTSSMAADSFGRAGLPLWLALFNTSRELLQYVRIGEVTVMSAVGSGVGSHIGSV